MEGGEFVCWFATNNYSTFCFIHARNPYFSNAQNVCYFLLPHLTRPSHCSRPSCRPPPNFRGVWYEHDVTSDDEAEEIQGSTAEDQDGEGSGDEDELEDSYGESD